MNDSTGVLAAAKEVQDKLSGADFQFCVIGGIALQRWGEPRFTFSISLLKFYQITPPAHLSAVL